MAGGGGISKIGIKFYKYLYLTLGLRIPQTSHYCFTVPIDFTAQHCLHTRRTEPYRIYRITQRYYTSIRLSCHRLDDNNIDTLHRGTRDWGNPEPADPRVSVGPSVEDRC